MKVFILASALCFGLSFSAAAGSKFEDAAWTPIESSAATPRSVELSPDARAARAAVDESSSDGVGVFRAI